jgi:transcriptional regulator with XRE-family HTH domain
MNQIFMPSASAGSRPVASTPAGLGWIVPSDNRLGEYLQARRAQVPPAATGPGRRRVAGLRRAELAELAGISEPYLVRLEQGRDRHPSAQVLTALGRALRLDPDGLAHLHRLAGPTAPPPGPEALAPGMQDLLDAWATVPAYVRGRHFDVLAANALATALVPSHAPGHNLARDVFLDPRMQSWYANWPAIARSTVAALRAAPDDPQMRALVAGLSQDSDTFRDLWSRHDVAPTRDETKLFRHPQAGEFALRRHVLEIAGGHGQVVIAYQPPPGDEIAAAALRLIQKQLS